MKRAGHLRVLQFTGEPHARVTVQGSSLRYRHWIVRTPFGVVPLRLGDWLITTREGEVSTCPDGVFQNAYEVLE